ncbi:DMT family transporter [Brevibacillus dissolubilis]|uniref:DMT family transporter n=1 Tax=Brevibacillus dissolubilis TaxID=1844116 RepID=UPI0011164833|nr:DMT family transporter [Brevibacillus dissolubilis]
MSSRYIYFLPMLATMLWGGNFLVSRTILPYLPPFTLSAARWMLAVLILLPFVYRELSKNGQQYKKHWKEALMLGATGISVFTVMIYIAMGYTTTINAAILSSWSPILIALGSFFFLKERISSLQISGFVVSSLGVLWIVSKGSVDTILSLQFNKGDMIIIFANLFWAFYSVALRKTSAKLPGLTGFFCIALAGALCLLPGAVWEMSTRDVQLFRIENLYAVLYLGIFASVAAFFSWNKAIQTLGPSNVSPFINFIPVFASVFAIVFLGESMENAQSVGGLFVLAGVWLSFQKVRGVRRVKQAESTAHAREVNA